MTDIWVVLVGFLARVMGGMSLFLLVVPAAQTNADYFRLKAWIILGLGTIATVGVWTHPQEFYGLLASIAIIRGLSLTATVAAYIASVAWLYHLRGFGKVCLAGIAVLTLALGTICTLGGFPAWFAAIEATTASGVLGGTLTTMMLGHWYLNSPQMDLRPIRLLTILLGAALVARALTAAAAVVFWPAPDVPVAFAALRWTAGILLPIILCGLVWGTLRVPNTQSATGILYAILILVFIGELVAQLSASTATV